MSFLRLWGNGLKGFVTDTNPVPVKSVDENGDYVGPGVGGGGDASAANQTEIINRLGEVQASPTANTLLGRIKDLLTGIVLAAGSNIIGKVGIDQTTSGTTNGVFALENSDIVPVALSLDIAAYSGGDLLADTQAISNFVRANDLPALIQNITVIDKDDQKQPLTIFFLSANVSLGTENAAPSITDADAVNILGWIDIAVADYKDLGGVAVAQPSSFTPFIVKPATGTRTVYVAAVMGAGGSGTYTASGVVLNIGRIGV